jgi:hypothetical protein
MKVKMSVGEKAISMECIWLGLSVPIGVFGGAARSRGVDSADPLLTEVLHLLAVFAVHICDICFEHLSRCGYSCQGAS